MGDLELGMMEYRPLGPVLFEAGLLSLDFQLLGYVIAPFLKPLETMKAKHGELTIVTEHVSKFERSSGSEKKHRTTKSPEEDC
ncbi:predicted protein [Sclerotinia sclerotiorum 1980 UF-70]|uniref:Uncharacterized protein n=1 Tax=Sclerotinia sclerotiorum (strain ATCC 18683 / 1980 / Ss-1) TaxID=665079 RepID=A7F0F8_SCLS1|nr:predicted protein [Sclerotinia sclerotiorum 1980 UF-70]EDN95200.1 predicted protein [Sclerotinia sclerotiorum 1980 UF-70]